MASLPGKAGGTLPENHKEGVRILRGVWKEQLQEQKIWLLLLLFTNLFYCLVLWMADVEAFLALTGVIGLGSFLLFFGAVSAGIFRQKREEEAFWEFLKSPDAEREKRACQRAGESGKRQIQAVGTRLREEQEKQRRYAGWVKSYEEYVESWAHEVKTPLALMTFLLDNRKEELDEGMYQRLEHIRAGISDDVTQMLYYARLRSDTKDYLFEWVPLCQSCQEVLEEQSVFLEELKFEVLCETDGLAVFTDRRGVKFMLSQVIQNAVKYVSARRKPFLGIYARDTGEGSVEVVIRDHGIGARPYDLPFLFEKGFTGESGEDRKKATGMGLYLVREMAKDLKVDVTADSLFGEWFEIRFCFPKVAAEKTEEENRV